MKEPVAVIIPAYNVSKSIVKLIKKILNILPQAVVYIVEDSSPDGTGKIIKKFFRNNKKVHLLIREQKLGRGTAVLLGIKEALKNKKIEKIIEMDADFYHNPKFLPDLLQKGKKSDVVIASRYVKSSQIYGWTWKRRVFSAIANLWARFILGLLSVKDITNGYRLYNRKTAELISRCKFHSSGFATLSEILTCASKNDLSIIEIPTVVRYEKTYGSSFSLKEIKEAFLTSLFLRFSLWYDKFH